MNNAIADCIALLGNKGFNPAHWVLDADINGAWCGTHVCTNVYLTQDKRGVFLVDNHANTCELILTTTD